MRARIFAVTMLIGAAVAAPASAHLGLDDPPSRYGFAVLKTAPCGMAGGTRSENVTTFEAGQTITVKWNEYINHPGHYRIAFDDDGDDDFVEPACLANCDNTNMEIEQYSNDTVLMDGIADSNGGDYSVELTLPDVVCDNCTLQVIQVMTDKPPYTIGGNDNYYQCADLVLVAAGTGPDMGTGEVDLGTVNNEMPDTGAAPDSGGTNPNNVSPDVGTTPGLDSGTTSEDESGGCSTAATPASPAWLALIFLGFLGLRRRI